MRHAQRFSIGMGCLLSLIGACSNNAGPSTTQTPVQSGGTPGTPTSTAGTTGTAGTPVTTGTAGATTPRAGTTAPATGGAGTTGGAAGSTTSAGGTPATATAGTTGAAGGAAGGGAPASGAGFKACGKPAKEGMCKATAPGVYAMKVDVDVWYMDEVTGALFDPGRGKISIYFRNTLTDVCEDGTGGTALAHPCGSRIPGLYSSAAGNKVFQIVFPDDLWDKMGVPDYKTGGGTSSFDPGGILTIEKTVGLLGLELTAPDATWPTFEQTPTFSCGNGKTGSACFVDVDGDGRPGFAVSIQTTGTPADPGYGTGWAFAPAPTDPFAALSGMGTTKVDIGLRTRVGGSGAIGADCKSGTGDADADDFESRVNDCTKLDGSKCSAMEVSFVDQNTPAFHVLKAGQTPPAMWMNAYQGKNKEASTGPKATVVRLGDVGQTFTCEQVRAAIPAM